MKPSAVSPTARDAAIREELPELSVVVVNWNTREALLECLESLGRASGEISLEVVVVDNGSLDGSAEAVEARYPGVRLLANRRNAGFARANNQAFPHCRGRYILLLNPDTRVDAAALEGLVAFMDRTPGAGAAGLQLRDPDGRLQNSYDNFPGLATELLSKHLLRLLFPRRYPSKRTIPQGPLPVDIVIGACLILRPQLLRQLHGFDERFFLFVEEADLCRRIWNSGWKVFHLPHLSICHSFHHSKAQAPAHAYIEYLRSSYLFFRKHSSPPVFLTFRLLKTLKLLLISLPLSVIACTFTLGRVPRHRRRLRIRSLLAIWHLLGCPSSWGMRQVSGFRGYERERGTVGVDFREAVLRGDLSTGAREILRDPTGCLHRGELEVEVTKRGRRKIAFRFKLGGGDTFLLTHYRPRNLLEALLAVTRVPPGLRSFERALEVSDRGVPTLLPCGAGQTRRRGVPSESWIAHLEDPDLMRLQRALEMDREAGRGRDYRARLSAYGRFVRRLHDTGVDQYDLNPGNALVRARSSAGDDRAILFADLERVKVVAPPGREARLDALARLNRIRAGFSRADRLRFLSAYLPAEGGRAALRQVVVDIESRMPLLRDGEGRRAARNCTRENYFFGRLSGECAGHYRRRSFPWVEAPCLDGEAAVDLARRVLRGEPLPAPLAVTEVAARRGLPAWREANRAFQSGVEKALPLLHVRCGAVDRIVLSRDPAGS